MLIAPLVFGLSPASVAICLQKDNVPWFQHHSAKVMIIRSLLASCLKHVLMLGLIQIFHQSLLESGHIIINVYNAPSPDGRKEKVNRESGSVPKQQVMWAKPNDS